MRKTALLVLALFVALLLLVQAYGGRRQAVAQARAAASHLRLQRDSLTAEVEARNRERSALIRERQAHEAEVAHLRQSVAQLEQSRAEAQLTVREIRTTGALQLRLRSTFPELGDNGWGLTTLPFQDGDTLGLEYLLVPAWFAETFIIDHANAVSWHAQKHRLLELDSLHSVVVSLQDSVTRLVAANAAAYATGYDAAYASHQVLTRRYIAELNKPRFKLPSIVGFVAAAGVGFVVGRVVP
jgi:flagellar motor protein MotB